MSILNPLPNEPITNAQRIANSLKQQARNAFRSLVGVYTTGSKSFWQNPAATPQEIAAALGTDGAELFQLHAKIGQLLADVKPDSVAEGLSVVGQFSINEDGVITIPTAEVNH